MYITHVPRSPNAQVYFPSSQTVSRGYNLLLHTTTRSRRLIELGLMMHTNIEMRLDYVVKQCLRLCVERWLREHKIIRFPVSFQLLHVQRWKPEVEVAELQFEVVDWRVLVGIVRWVFTFKVKQRPSMSESDGITLMYGTRRTPCPLDQLASLACRKSKRVSLHCPGSYLCHWRTLTFAALQ